MAKFTKKTDAPAQPAPETPIKGFLLGKDNPYGDGVIRAYRKAGGDSKQENKLPFILPEGTAATKAALENYLLRSCGDPKIIAEVRKVLPEVPKVKKVQ